MPTLRIVSGVNAGQTFDISQKETLLGRDTFCDVTLPARTVSRQHARIIQEPNGYYIEDLQSVNGTRVNNQRAEGRVRVRDQDNIVIHDIVLRFELETEIHQPAASPAATAAATAEQPLKDEPSNVVKRVDAQTTPEDLGRDASLVKLRAVIELTKNLGSTLEQDKVLPDILDCLFEIFPQTERGYILQGESADSELAPIAIKHRQGETDTISPLGGKVVDRVMQDGTAFLSSDAVNDDRLEEIADSVLDEGIRSVMCAPLIGPSRKPLGVIHIETTDPRNPFVQRDLDVLVSVGNLAGRAAEAAKMHETILALDRQKHELGMARDVQLHFLPHGRPEKPGYQFFDFYRAADHIAGDYYDYIELPDGRLVVALGDVSGKGISAALLMARLCSEVRYSLLATDTPSEAVEQLNRQLSRQLVGDRFVTLILCVIDTRNHRVSIVNAGHTPPLARLGAETEDVIELGRDQVCLPLAVEKDTEYMQFDLELTPGAIVLAYTDGVNDAVDPTGEYYGYQRVRNVVSRTNPDPTHVVQAIVADVRSFAAGQPQSDDMCLLCFGREP